MGYETKLEILAAVRVTIPEGHPLYIGAGSNTLVFGPYPELLTEREILVEELRLLGSVEQIDREAIDAGRLAPTKEYHQTAAYRQHVISLLQEILYDGDEDAEALACPSSRHELEEDHYPTPVPTTWAARYALAFGVTSAEAMENLHPEAKAQVEKILGTRRIQPSVLEQKVREVRRLWVAYMGCKPFEENSILDEFHQAERELFDMVKEEEGGSNA